MSTAITPANAASLLSEEIAKTAPEHKAKVRRIVASSVGENPILMADMYKATHAGQLPDKTETITSFFEARAGAKLHNIVNFGLQIILDDIAAICITWLSCISLMRSSCSSSSTSLSAILNRRSSTSV